MFLNVVLLYILVIKRKTPYTIINIALRSINIQQSITFWKNNMYKKDDNVKV